MGYTALYRTFRPKTFSEIVGQEHITQTIKNQIISNRVGHAYLLNGTRGTGKTSTAKILARAINCLNPKDGEPCNECEICKAALDGSLTDVVEMDAASNNSVDDIRAIRDEVNFLPTLAKYRVYIIDEVHMLSTGAFNALLKTLEEPPEHVKFILATTEPQKLPATILSRCQRFDFKKIPNKDIIKRLKIVCKESKLEYTEDALNIIAVLSEGAMRDALSILERCVQDGENKIDSEKIKNLVGIPKTTHIHGIIKAIIEYNIEEALRTTNEVLEDGKDLNNFVWEMIKYSKDVLIYQASGKLEIYNDDEKKQIEELSKQVTKEKLVNIIYQLSSLERDLKNSTQKVIMFQAGIINLCNKDCAKADTLEERVEKIEKFLRNTKVVPTTNVNIGNAQSIVTPTSQQSKQLIDKTQKTKQQVPQTSQSVQATQVPQTSQTSQERQTSQVTSNPRGKTTKENFWPQVLNELKTNGKMVLCSNLTGTQAKEINDMTVGIYFSKPLSPFGKTVLEKEENRREISRLVSISLGKTMNIKYMEEAPKIAEEKKEDIQQIAEGNNIPFKFVD